MTQLFKPKYILLALFVVLAFAGMQALQKHSPMLRGSNSPKIGDAIDSLNGVKVYYNGPISNVSGRNMSKDGYNLGLKYQCVEFVKRYYYQHLKHKMPDSYGHAYQFFQTGLKDGGLNKQRNLTQYTNPSKSKPKVNDLIVFKGTSWNQYGHVAIISKVNDTDIEIIQQNAGPGGSSRERIPLKKQGESWLVQYDTATGWLRKL